MIFFVNERTNPFFGFLVGEHKRSGQRENGGTKKGKIYHTEVKRS